MKLTKHIQGSASWLEWRKTGVTASDAAIINGTNTFGGNSPLKLYQKKFDIADEEPTNHAMMEGSLLEKEALERFNKDHSTNFVKPCGSYHDELEWVKASLDGYDEKSDYLLEIKCGVNTYDKATDGFVPPYYFDQIQHQLFVSGKQHCYYMAYRPGKEPVVIIIERDVEYFKKVLEKEKEFYECMVKLIPPGLGEKEFVEIKGDRAREIKRRWKESKEILNDVTKTEKLERQKLLDETDGGNCIFPDGDVKVERRTKKGAIDYDALLKAHNINKQELEKFRKPECSWLQPSIIKQT